MAILEETLLALIHESKNPQIKQIKQRLSQFDAWQRVQLLNQILCIRPPSPALPADLLHNIDTILAQQRAQRVVTLGSSIPPLAIFKRSDQPDVQIKLWQGDITSLASDVNIITNAANSQMLGCFQPSHKCIDNVIHSAAGPRLREECFEIMTARGCELPAGEAVTTKGYCLPSPHVIHTVGPQLARGATPTTRERQQLMQCYESVLSQVESLAANEDGSKRAALCGISTGLFAFPTTIAAKIAFETVQNWVVQNSGTTITDIILVTFAEGDYQTYSRLFTEMQDPWQRVSTQATLRGTLQLTGETLKTAQKWLESAGAIVVSAGAGLSAADGLDYTSRALFKKHFPNFLKMGLTTLYNAIGFDEWPSEADKWAYYFANIQMVRSWPSWELYQRLIPWLKTFGENAHVRTSNADGLFLANGWNEEQLSTPQGRYAVLQCLATCRPDSTFETLPYFEAAVSFLDPDTQRLTDPSKVPRCPNCDGDMMICVRGGPWFNERPFQAGEARWKEFRTRVLQSGQEMVILELGVGLNTPGVLRMPNENLVRRGRGCVKLIRVGLGPSVVVPSDLQGKGLAIAEEGDIQAILPELVSNRTGYGSTRDR